MKGLEDARAMQRTQVMQPALSLLEAKPGPASAAQRKKRIKGKKAPAVSKRGDAPRGGEKGTAVPKNFQGTRKVAAPVKYPRKLPTEAQLRNNAAKRAAMVVRDGLNASKPQDRLKSLRPY